MKTFVIALQKMSLCLFAVCCNIKSYLLIVFQLLTTKCHEKKRFDLIENNIVFPIPSVYVLIMYIHVIETASIT